MSQSINRAYKFRIYPTRGQEAFFAKHFGCCRFIYNHFLALRTKVWKEETKSLGGFECKRMIAQMKKQMEYEWLQEANSQALQESCLDLEKSFRRFFKKLGGYPRFHSKRGRQSFRVSQGFFIDSEKGNIKIPKLKSPISTVFHREMSSFRKVNHLVISKNTSGKYFVSINGEVETVLRKTPFKKEIGIDLGLHHFIKTTDNQEIAHPRNLRKSMKRLGLIQKRHSRKVKGSKNRDKHRIKLARFHEKILNKRMDFLHKLSRKIVDENQVIYLEDLNVKGMMRNRHLAQAIGDSGWSEFIRQLKYKSAWSGGEVIEVGRYEPTTKLCSTSGCDYQHEALGLSVREWQCPKCEVWHDRDLNAARNIKQIGQDMPKLKPVKTVTAVFSLKRKQVTSMKQEPPHLKDAR